MSEEGGNPAAGGLEPQEKRGDTRKSKTVRFSDPEWEIVEKAAARRGIPAAEYVRTAALDAAEGKKCPAVFRNHRANPANLPKHLHPIDVEARRNAS